MRRQTHGFSAWTIFYAFFGYPDVICQWMCDHPDTVDGGRHESLDGENA